MSAIATAVVRRRVPLAAGVCVLSFVLFWAAQRTAQVSMIDLSVYRAEGMAARAGVDLYALRATEYDLPMTYPPFAALLFTPLTLLDLAELRPIVTLGNLLLLFVFVRLSLRLVGAERHARVETALWVSAAAVWAEPVWTTLRYGQVNLLLAVLVLWGLTRRPDHRWAGVGIGVAAAIKLTPGLFALFLLLVGAVAGARGSAWRPAVRHACVAAAAFLGATLAATVVLPEDSRNFWTRVIFEADRAGRVENTANQSVRGVLARLLHTPEPGAWWAVGAAGVCVAGLAVAVVAAARGERAWGAVACAATALLVSPVSWSHHWVWCVPMALLLWTRAERWGGRGRWVAAGGLGLAFCSYALWWVPHRHGRPELDQNFGEMTLSAVYPLAAFGFLAVAAAVALGRPRRDRADRASGRDGRTRALSGA
ncbi:glycosyltransferase 87 family protein [Streptomyces flavofungini]|uniref:glycosyltransferase 87 family protein n=1 Tax=Streptomyces flavofungini TaxID=68200 RepID=UPI0025B19310|nr:glycosyltransferase 87 family protein [Streptomyces flavofungini]WJV48746.1 glycosyltransferase 87 family protein [Streptomyces flavofungini]